MYEPLLLLGKGKEGDTGKWGSLDFKIRVKGGGYVSQIYAIRQAISRGLIAFNQKYFYFNFGFDYEEMEIVSVSHVTLMTATTWDTFGDDCKHRLQRR